MNFVLLGNLVGVACSLCLEATHLLFDEVKAVVDRQIFGDVVDDQVKTALEDPRGREEARPGLHRVVKGLGLRRHEESRIATDLAQFRVAHLRLDDRVDEVKGKGMIFHLH